MSCFVNQGIRKQGGHFRGYFTMRLFLVFIILPGGKSPATHAIIVSHVTGSTWNKTTGYTGNENGQGKNKPRNTGVRKTITGNKSGNNLLINKFIVYEIWRK